MKHPRLFALLWLMLLAALSINHVSLATQAIQLAHAVTQNPAPGGAKGVVESYLGSGLDELHYVAYLRRDAKIALVYLHGIESHAGWFALAAQQLHRDGYNLYCLDRRGSGLNRENRGFTSGHVDSYETLLADIHAFVMPLHKRYDQVFLVGLSWGGKLALSYGLSHPETIDGLVLITPGLRSIVDVSLWSKLKIVLLSPWRPTARVQVPIEPSMFTTTPEYLAYIREDPLRLTSATVRFFYQSHRLDTFLDRNMSENRLPIQLFLAANDTIIDNDGVLEVLRKNQTTALEVLTYEDQTHSIQLDAPERLVKDITDWIARHRKAD